MDSFWQNQQHQHHQLAHHSSAPSPPTTAVQLDWQRDRTSRLTPSGYQPNYEQQDHTSFLNGASTQTSPLATQQFFSPYTPIPPSSFNNYPPYGHTMFDPPHTWTGSVPLSTYSSLNGATSSSAPEPAAPMVIDPSLVMIPSSTASYGSQVQPQLFSPPSVSPSVLHPPHNPSQPPHTIQSYPASTPIPAANPSSIESLREILVPQRLESSPTDTASLLIQSLKAIKEPDKETRLLVLTSLRDHAPKELFQFWVHNSDGMAIFRDWVKKGVADTAGPYAETMMPLLHVIDRLPFTVEVLKSVKLGKYIKLLIKDFPSAAVKDMASGLELKWTSMATTSSHSESSPDPPRKLEGNGPEGASVKKRKVTEPPPKLPPSKRPALAGTGPQSKPAPKKEPKVVMTAVVPTKTDTGFFSKPKAKLPSFKKATPPTVPVNKPEDSSVAQPSTANAFQEAMKIMSMKGKTRLPNNSDATQTTTNSSSSGEQPKKKRKTVTFAPDDKLEMVKWIQRAVYDDDPADGVHQMHNIRDLDRDEGAALHAHQFEEQIDWSEPLPLELPDEIMSRMRGSASQEVSTQEEREKSALTAIYLPGQIPDNPSEPTNVSSDDQLDVDVTMMVAGADLDSDQPANATVSNLVAQLAASTSVPTDSMDTYNMRALGIDPSLLQGILNFAMTPEQKEQMRLQAEQQQQQLQSVTNGDQNWTNLPVPVYGQSGIPAEDEEQRRNKRQSDGAWNSRGGGSRGGHRGGSAYRGKKRPCSFFAVGRCKYGDQCDFLHEL